jgi:uncharacterized protein
MNPEFREEPFWGWTDLAWFLGLLLPAGAAGLFAVRTAFAITGAPPGKPMQAVIVQFVIYGFWFVALAILLRVRHDRPFWRSLGWRVPWPFLAQTLLLGPALAMFIALLGVALGTPNIDAPIRDLLTSKTAVIVVGVLAACVGPICEELFFRGFLQPLLVRATGAAAGILLAALPFAVLHGPQYQWSWRHILLLIVAASVFGVVRQRTDSTAASAWVHAGYNLVFYTGYLMQRGNLPL